MRSVRTQGGAISSTRTAVSLQQEALRQDVGMERRLGRRIDRRHRHRHEPENGAGIGDDGVALALQMLDQRRRHADRPHQIGRDRVDHQLVVDPAGGRDPAA